MCAEAQISKISRAAQMPTEEESNTINFNQRRRRPDNETNTNQKLNIFTYIFGLQYSWSTAKMKKGNFWSQRQQFKDTSISIRKYPCLKKCEKYTKWNIYAFLYGIVWWKRSTSSEKEEIEGYARKHASVVGRAQARFEAVVYSTSVLHTVTYSCWRFFEEKVLPKISLNPQFKNLALCPVYTLRQTRYGVNHSMVDLLP